MKNIPESLQYSTSLISTLGSIEVNGFPSYALHNLAILLSVVMILAESVLLSSIQMIFLIGYPKPWSLVIKGSEFLKSYNKVLPVEVPQAKFKPSFANATLVISIDSLNWSLISNLATLCALLGSKNSTVPSSNPALTNP